MGTLRWCLSGIALSGQRQSEEQPVTCTQERWQAQDRYNKRVYTDTGEKIRRGLSSAPLFGVVVAEILLVNEESIKEPLDWGNPKDVCPTPRLMKT